MIRALMTQAREVVDRDRSEGTTSSHTWWNSSRGSPYPRRAGEPAGLVEYAAGDPQGRPGEGPA